MFNCGKQWWDPKWWVVVDIDVSNLVVDKETTGWRWSWAFGTIFCAETPWLRMILVDLAQYRSVGSTGRAGAGLVSQTATLRQKSSLLKRWSWQPSVLPPQEAGAQRFRPFFALGRFSKDLRTCRMGPLMRISLLLAFWYFFLTICIFRVKMRCLCVGLAREAWSVACRVCI